MTLEEEILESWKHNLGKSVNTVIHEVEAKGYDNMKVKNCIRKLYDEDKISVGHRYGGNPRNADDIIIDRHHFLVL